jgi:hypothetical protein
MTPVTRPGALLGCAVLAAGVLTAVPASADPPPDPISGLVGQLLGQKGDSGQRDSQRNERGRTHADDGVLRRGCHNHPYRYVVKVRTDDWTLETFLDDRTGETVASGAYSADADPRKGRGVFRFCRYSTYAGRFTIRAKLSWYTDAGEHRGWFEPSHFRLRRP